MKISHFLLGAVTGAAVGAATVLFNTPESGEKLRNSLKQSANNLKDQLADVKKESGNVKQSITLLSIELKNNIPVIINDFRNSLTHFQKEIEPNVNQLKTGIENLNSSIAEIEKNLNDFNKKDRNTSVAK